MTGLGSRGMTAMAVRTGAAGWRVAELEVFADLRCRGPRLRGTPASSLSNAWNASRSDAMTFLGSTLA